VSPRFNDHFPGRPELAGSRMSAFWILMELRVMEVVVTTGAISRAKL